MLGAGEVMSFLAADATQKHQNLVLRLLTRTTAQQRSLLNLQWGWMRWAAALAVRALTARVSLAEKVDLELWCWLY